MIRATTQRRNESPSLENRQSRVRPAEEERGVYASIVSLTEEDGSSLHCMV